MSTRNIHVNTASYTLLVAGKKKNTGEEWDVLEFSSLTELKKYRKSHPEKMAFSYSYALTRDEIERLWNPQGMAAQPAQPAADTSARTEKPAPRWFRLSNGRQVNLADWKVVLFMQGHCPYCHQFDPVAGCYSGA